MAARLAAEHKRTHVVYHNGARVPAHARAEAAPFNCTRQAGVTMVEDSDGRECGWTAHQNTDKANRSARRAEDAAEWALFHPRCRRRFGPRPDLTSV